MKVRIETKDCIGAGLCEDACRAQFMMEDGIAYPKLPDETPETVPRDSEGRPFHPGSGDLGWVAVRADLVDDVREAADVCPVECIFIDEE